MTNIKEVARVAGVSSATVSHVMNGTRFVSEATRAKVEAAIAELQYSPNILARSFKTGARETVGFVVPDIANGYFATLIEQVEDVLQTHGYRLIVTNTRENPIRELDTLRMLSSGLVDGLLLASTLDHYDEIAAALPAEFPVVLVDRTLPAAPLDTVVTDNASAIRTALTALVERGHRRIGLLASVPHLSTTVERVGAYFDVLNEYTIPIEPALVRYLDLPTEPVAPVVADLRAAGCTAVLASNNVLTTKLRAVLAGENGSGAALEILGYRDPTHPAVAAPDVVWLEEPVAELGRAAAEAIVERLADPQRPVERTTLQAQLAHFVSNEVLK